MPVLEPYTVVCKQRVPLRPKSPRGRARVLFLSMYHLGWKTWSRYIERYTPLCTEMDAVHVHVVQPFWMKLANRPLPRPIGRGLLTPARAWRWHVRHHFSKLILSREFDALFVNSQVLAPALVDLCRIADTKLMICTDVTGPAYVRDLLGQSDAGRSWQEEHSIFAACSLVVPMSDWIADSLVRDFRVPRERVMVVPPVIDPASPAPAQNNPSEKDRLPRILFCGNDWQRKGGARLVRWHQKYWADLAELHLVSNDADVRPGLKNVINHGAVPNERMLKEILPSADVFCLPTTQDMSPFAVTEAQAFGIPTVASRVGGMANLVLHQKTGYLVSPHDEAGFVAAVSDLLRDADLRATMRQAASLHARIDLNAAVLLPKLLNRIVEVAQAA